MSSSSSLLHHYFIISASASSSSLLHHISSSHGARAKDDCIGGGCHGKHEGVGARHLGKIVDDVNDDYDYHDYDDDDNDNAADDYCGSHHEVDGVFAEVL